MKRKEFSTSNVPPSRRRQPQISCKFCRAKKLKCDRGAPCSNCVARGLPCQGSPALRTPRTPPRDTNSDGFVAAEILERLRTLEQAVWRGDRRGGTTPLNSDKPGPGPAPHREASNRPLPYASVAHTPASSLPESEHQQTAKFLDSTYTKEDFSISGTYSRHKFYIQGTNSADELKAAAQAENLQGGRLIGVMSREEALSLLRDFLENSYHLLPVIHEASTRALIDDFYARLTSNQAVDPACAALILSIAATSAYFWNTGATSYLAFSSAEVASKSSLAWRKAAFEVLDGSRSDTSLEDVQARTILSYLIYNTEGLSARSRFLHGWTLAAAREIGLHLVDSPRSNQLGDAPTREIKRRLWWHLASTDWMMGLMGSPLDGTYTVQPRFMNVKYPRNLNDNDLSLCEETFTFPLNVPTQMSCFLQRIRLGEIIRAVVDARPPGEPDVEILGYDTVRSLDRLFEQALLDCPPFLRVGAPIPPGAPRYLDLQRSIIHLGFFSRRARLHRPFLLQNNQERLYQDSVKTCLRSARTVLSIASELLQRSLEIKPNNSNESYSGETRPSSSPSYHRLGPVISHMFLACTILALNEGLQSGAGDVSGVATTDPNTAASVELSHACELLSAAGKESPVAAGLVRSLVGVLRRYHVRSAEDVGLGESQTHLLDGEASTVDLDDVACSPTARNYQDTCRSVANTDDLGLDDLWNDIMSTMPMNNGWDQVFAELDTFCAAA